MDSAASGDGTFSNIVRSLISLQGPFLRFEPTFHGVIRGELYKKALTLVMSFELASHSFLKWKEE